LGNALVQQGRLAEAARCYERAVRLQPGHVEARHNLGIALIQQGQVEEAVKHLEAAARQRPGDAGVAGNLGLALVQLGGKLAGEGKRADAMRHYRRAVELDGRRVEALNALAWMLATDTNGAIRNAEEAIGYAQRACELTTNSVAIYLDTLGVAYSEAGRFKEAVQVTERAAAQARQLGNQELAARIESRLKHYRAGRAYHTIPKGPEP
jgi:tetratricopeptide (TPR) repeat protein